MSPSEDFVCTNIGCFSFWLVVWTKLVYFKSKQIYFFNLSQSSRFGENKLNAWTSTWFYMLFICCWKSRFLFKTSKRCSIHSTSKVCLTFFFVQTICQSADMQIRSKEKRYFVLNSGGLGLSYMKAWTFFYSCKPLFGFREAVCCKEKWLLSPPRTDPAKVNKLSKSI